MDYTLVQFTHPPSDVFRILLALAQVSSSKGGRRWGTKKAEDIRQCLGKQQSCEHSCEQSIRTIPGVRLQDRRCGVLRIKLVIFFKQQKTTSYTNATAPGWQVLCIVSETRLFDVNCSLMADNGRMWLTNVYKTAQEYVMNAGYAMICMAIFGSIQLRSLAGGIPHFALTSSMQPTAIERVYLLSFQLVWCLMLLPFEQGRCCSFFLAQNLIMEYYGAVWSCLYCPQNLPTQKKKKNEVSMLAGHRELQNQSLMLSQMPTFIETWQEARPSH